MTGDRVSKRGWEMVTVLEADFVKMFPSWICSLRLLDDDDRPKTMDEAKKKLAKSKRCILRCFIAGANKRCQTSNPLIFS